MTLAIAILFEIMCSSYSLNSKEKTVCDFEAAEHFKFYPVNQKQTNIYKLPLSAVKVRISETT